MSAVERYRIALARSRRRALERERAEQRLAEVQDRVLHLPEVARILGIHENTTRRWMDIGRLRGAYIERGRWCMRAVDLCRFLRTDRLPEVA